MRLPACRPAAAGAAGGHAERWARGSVCMGEAAAGCRGRRCCWCGRRSVCEHLLDVITRWGWWGDGERRGASGRKWRDRGGTAAIGAAADGVVFWRRRGEAAATSSSIRTATPGAGRRRGPFKGRIYRCSNEVFTFTTTSHSVIVPLLICFFRNTPPARCPWGRYYVQRHGGPRGPRIAGARAAAGAYSRYPNSVSTSMPAPSRIS